MSHPSHGSEWKSFNDKHKEFATDPRNIRLGLASDGFNPFGHQSATYSMWPVLVIPYNMPPNFYTKESNYMMALLIPGPKSPGKDFDLFMETLEIGLFEQTGWRVIATPCSVVSHRCIPHCCQPMGASEHGVCVPHCFRPTAFVRLCPRRSRRGCWTLGSLGQRGTS